MSDQVPPQATQPGQAQQGPPPGLGAKPYDIHKCAMDAEAALEKLATELGKADVEPGVIKAVSGMADAMRRIATSMAKTGAESEQAPAGPEAGRPTMDSATNDLAAAAQRRAA